MFSSFIWLFFCPAISICTSSSYDVWKRQGLITPLWLSSNSFLWYQPDMFSSLPWRPIDSLSGACFITKNYSSIDGQEGILINVTFVINNLVILSRPNKMRIWLCLRLIIKSCGEPTLYIAIDHVWRQAYPVNTHSQWKIVIFLWLHPAEESSFQKTVQRWRVTKHI